MAKQITAIQIKNSGDGKLADGRGLFLLKKGETGRWVYRYQFQTRRRDMGLGSYPDMSLAAARMGRRRRCRLRSDRHPPG
jgi:hypothetical protein